MKNIIPPGLFDDHFIMEKLTKLGDPLQKKNEFIHWKILESPINEAFKDEDRDLSKGGRPPFNRLMLMKPLMQQGFLPMKAKWLTRVLLKPRASAIPVKNREALTNSF